MEVEESYLACKLRILLQQGVGGGRKIEMVSLPRAEFIVMLQFLRNVSMRLKSERICKITEIFVANFPVNL